MTIYTARLRNTSNALSPRVSSEQNVKNTHTHTHTQTHREGNKPKSGPYFTQHTNCSMSMLITGQNTSRGKGVVL